MTLISKFMIVAILLFSTAVSADAANRAQLIRFAKALGLYEQIEAQKVGIEQQARQVAIDYAQEINASIGSLPPEFTDYVKVEIDVYMSNVRVLVDPNLTVDIYLRLVSQKLSRSEIQQLTVFYESDLGQKFTRANTQITPRWMGEIDDKITANVEGFAQRLMLKAASYAD